MVVLLDLDGTLINTAHSSFKAMKDGVIETDLLTIPIIKGSKEFILKLLNQNHSVMIISDSHPNYVHPISKEVFNLPALSLADKPNVKKTIDFLKQQGYDISKKGEFIVIGDTWLDIELARGLNFSSILTQFYVANEVDERDGIGKTWHQLKSGPTYVVKQFEQILEILSRPLKNLWAAEAVFQNENNACAIRLKDFVNNGNITIFRSLGRQDIGECDSYAIATYYTEFQRTDRSSQTLKKLAQAVENFICNAISVAPHLIWDYITYVADKATTNPPNKMRDFFNEIESPIPKVELLKWENTVDGSIRDRINHNERRMFIKQNLHVTSQIDLTEKSIIVIDDQFTTGGTAYEIVNMLRKKGVKNVLFLTLFFMISSVSSNKNCSRCGKPMHIKIRKTDGIKFFSCIPPKYRGDGCGHIENIAQ